MASTGTGTTIAGVGLPIVGRVQRISGLPLSVAALDDTALDSTEWMEKCPADLGDIDVITVDVLVDGSADDFLGLAVEGEEAQSPFTVREWTIEYASGLTIAGTGWVSRIVSTEAVANQRTRFVFDLQYDGKTFSIARETAS